MENYNTFSMYLQGLKSKQSFLKRFKFRQFAEILTLIRIAILDLQCLGKIEKMAILKN